MAISVDNETKVEEQLEDLVRLEHDAVAAYGSAIDRLHSGELRAELGEFAEDHRRHLAELGDLIAGMGRTVPRQGDAKRFLTRGKVVLGGLIGDIAVLYAMRSNEEETSAAYDRATDLAGANDEVRNVIERARHDERRHREWIAAKLKEMRDK